MPSQAELRKSRLKVGRLLLEAYKQNGGSVKNAAARLRVGQATVSHWRSQGSEEKRNIGAPTEDHLMKMTALLCEQIENNFEVLWRVMSEIGYGHGYLNISFLVKFLKPLLEGYSKAVCLEFDRADEMFDAMIAGLSEMQTEYGDKALETWFQSTRVQDYSDPVELFEKIRPSKTEIMEYRHSMRQHAIKRMKESDERSADGKKRRKKR